MTATLTEVVETFLSSLEAPTDQHDWDVNHDTYINHVPLVIDNDYQRGYLLEVVERSTSVVSYIVVVAFAGPDEAGRWDYDAKWYPDHAGTFFDRRMADYQIDIWAVMQIRGLIDSGRDRRRKRSLR